MAGSDRQGRSSRGRAGTSGKAGVPGTPRKPGKPSASVVRRVRKGRVAASGVGTGTKRSGVDEAEELSFGQYTGIRALLNPLWCYHGFRVAVAALTGFGIIMVFSSSSVDMVSKGASPFRQALSQGMYCVLGIVIALVASRLPTRFYQRVSMGAVAVAMFLQLLTLTPLGTGGEEYGNSGWIAIGGFSMQPAEVVKFALCLWLPVGLRVSRKRFAKEGIMAYRWPAIVFVVCLGLVVAGKDVGTALIIVFIGVAAFLIGGVPAKWFALGGALVVAGLILLVVTSPNRMRRIMATYTGCSDADAQDTCFQSLHAKYAMASGGFLGVGIGNSREKWQYLPAAHNDFIFAIIGEETGFVGASLVILLFVVLGWCMVAVALQTRDRYVSMALVCITVWFVGQGLVNIGVVVGIFPVLGVPMPFVSAGGSSLIMCLAAAGVVCAMMRTQPQIKASLARV